MRLTDTAKIHRTLIHVQKVKDMDDRDDVVHRRSLPPLERIRGLELLRQSMYDDDAYTARLSRFFEIQTS